MINLTIRPMTQHERKYSYSQSRQIMGQTCCIGHLRGDMGSSGKEFYSSWEDHRTDSKTEGFKSEFDDVINTLRFNESFGGVLKDRSALSHYCYAHPESSFGNDREFGFRADTEKYSYLLRLNPNPGNYNLYCYCYERKWLDRHIKQAEKGIRFIDPNYKELFRLSDGDMVRITTSTDEKLDRICRYIDDSHVEVGDSLYHICEFAELMEQNGNTVIPLRSSLPDQCYVYLLTTREIGIVKKGESGYYRTDIVCAAEDGKEIVMEVNERAGVSKAQTKAMLAGSMFGWGCPAADPKSYDENGKLIKPSQKERGEAR